jgi:hypothetical protein
MRSQISAASLVAFFIPALLAAQEPLQNGEGDRVENVAPRSREAAASPVDTSPVIDGRMDDQAWAQARVLGDFVQREPVEGRPVSEATEVRIVYDAEAIYIGAWLFDSDTSAIVVGETRRDAALTNTDAFQIILDTYLDRQNGFVFATTPAGIEYDGQVTKEGQGSASPRRGQRQQAGSGGGFNLNWDGSWEVATSVDADGWYAEFRIPFSTLRYPRGGEQMWGVNFSRNIRRHNEEAFWAPIPRQFNLYRVSMAGTLSQFVAPSQKVFTITPYVLGDAYRDYALQSSADFSPAVGGDAKIGLTQSLTLDLTVNTDFAQVEVDDQQVNLTRFPLFFPEKRPFFLENAGSFSVGTPQETELFFSRRIGLYEGNEVPIQAGARLTGKVAGMQVGFLNIQANHLDLLDEDLGEEVRVEPKNNFGVVRLFQEFENRTRIGGIFVHRLNTDDTNDYNLTYGADGRLGVGQALTFDGYLSGTTTPDVSSGEYAYHLGGTFETRDWNVAAQYREVGAEFNPEVGFLSRREYRYINARILRKFRFPEVPWFRELRPHVSWREYFDLTGFSETRVVHIDNHFEFSNGAFFQLPAVNFTGEGLQEPFEIREGIIIPAGSYNNFDWGFAFNTDLSAPFSAEGRIDIGGFYSGTRTGTNTTFNYRFRDKFTASFRVAYFDVRLAEGEFISSLLALKGSYSFTPRIFLQASLQYNNETENFGSNIRLGWLNTAGTGLYVVYNDTEHLGSLDRTGIERGPQERQLIIKYTKMFSLR